MFCKYRRKSFLCLALSWSFGTILVIRHIIGVEQKSHTAVGPAGHARLNLAPDQPVSINRVDNDSLPLPLNNASHLRVPLCANNDNLSFHQRLVTIDHFGQLGNNMFQYAGLLGVAKMNNRTPFILPTSPLTRVFQLSHVKEVPNTTKWKLIGEPRYAMYDPWYECLPKGPLLLQCYFQSYKYLHNVHQQIHNEFTFLPNIDQQAESILKRLPIDNKKTKVVGVHIRRGDKLTQKEIKSGERVAPLSYFQKAFDWMRNKYGSVVFLVATDDTSWVKATFHDRDVILLPPAPGPLSSLVLTKCDGVIMSVGTFGWWAGWLGNGDVIYFNRPMEPHSWKGKRFRLDDYYPKHWIGLGS